MNKLVKTIENKWIVEMTEEEYKNAVAVDFISLEVQSVMPIYRKEGNYLSLTFTTLPSKKFRPGDTLKISKV
jgi:hypothetical protein